MSTTTAFQWIINNAEKITINKRAIVAQTTARDQTVRSISRGGQVWRFTVTPASGLRFEDSRPYLDLIDKADRTTTALINFNRSEFDYLIGYQGDALIPDNMTCSRTSTMANTAPDTLTISTLPSMSSTGYLFRAGDYIQVSGSNSVYTIAEDVIRGTVSSVDVTLNRPMLEGAITSSPLLVGKNVTFRLICTQFPDWSVVSPNMVQWSGDFVFYESLA